MTPTTLEAALSVIAEREKKLNDLEAELTIVVRAIDAAFKDGRLDVKDPRNVQLGDIEESVVKWNSEQVGVMQSRITELEACLKEARDFVVTLPGGKDWLVERQISGPVSNLEIVLARARREVIEKCLAIVEEVSASYIGEEFPSLQAVGAETVGVVIRARFGIRDGKMMWEFTPCFDLGGKV